MSGETKECVACAEQIQANAKLCRFCNTLQNDRRFVAPQVQQGANPQTVTPAKSLAAAETLADLNNPNQKLCTDCKKFIVESQYYDRCEVCRGVSETGILPKGERQSVETRPSDVNLGAAQLSAAYSHVPLAPTPGIAIAAIIIAFFIPLLGLILGYAARTEVRNPNNPKEGDGLATFAIVVGWIWIFAGVVWLLVVIAAASTISSYEDMPAIGAHIQSTFVF